jgi:predicted TPR repeat methyltransferase
MSDEKGLLHKAYTIENTDQARDFYQDWAETYDEEITRNGYSTPRRCAESLAQFAPDKSAPLLDFGCGTGLSALALKAAGFTTIDGSDLSPEMLKRAAKRQDLYRDLIETDVENPFDFPVGTYQAIAAIGVIASSHAPAETIDAALAALPADGLLVFSLNDHTLQDPEFEARIVENLDTGMARLLFKEHGDHLPGHDLGSNVYVMQKA